MAKPIPDIPGAANQQLRSLKKNVQGAKFSSKLSDAKNKQLADEIVSEVLSELQGTDDFTLQLQNKITDIILGRITSAKAESDITQGDLDQIREELVKSLGDSSKLSDDIKQAASKCADLVVQSASPSGNTTEVINQIKELTEKVEDTSSAKDDAQPPAAEESDDDSESSQEEPALSKDKEDKQTQLADDTLSLKEKIGSQLKNSLAITGGITKILMSPVTAAMTAVSKTTDAISSSLKAAGKAISNTFNAANKALMAPFNAISDAYKNAKDAIKNGLVVPFKAIGNAFGNIFNSLNPLKAFKAKKKTSQEEQFYQVVEKLKNFIVNFGDWLVMFVKSSQKKLEKLFKKMLDNMIDGIVNKLASALKEIISKVEAKIHAAIVKMGAAVTAALGSIYPWILLIAAVILAIGVVVGVILIKFPEMLKPVIMVIPILIDVFGQIVEFVIKKLWKFFKEDLWPFLAETVWPFLRNTIWPFFTEKVFPIVEMIVDTIFNTIWPFVHEKLWPFIAEKFAQILDFLLTKVWPFVHDTLVWLRDTIITPVWEKFVVPMLEWLVNTIIPFIHNVVAPILANILDILNILLQALRPWIRPIVDVILGILDYVLDIMNKILVALEPVLLTIAQVIADVFVVVFNAIDQIVSPILRWLQEQLINLKKLWNAFVTSLTSIEFVGMRPFAFLDGCTFDVDKPPSGATPPKPETEGEANSGPSEFIQSLVNGIINATDVMSDAINALVWDQIKKKIKNIFAFLKRQQQNEAAVDEQVLNSKLNSNEMLSAIDNATKKLEKLSGMLEKMGKALFAVVKDICNIDLTIKADTEAKKTAEAEEKKQDEAAGFDPNEFLTELMSDTDDIQSANTEMADTIESTVSTAKENAMLFLQDALMPLIESMNSPLQETIDILSKPPEQTLEMNTIAANANTNEQNPALSDQ